VTEDEALARAAQALAAQTIPNPRREARLLLDRAGGDAVRLAALLARRIGGEPISHILGYRDFYLHRFEVTPDVLDPRPETETLVSMALEAPFSRVLDLGTGSGCILLSLLAARPDTTGLGVDISDAALAVARRNRAHLGLDARADLGRADWFEGVTGQFDLIVSNPPYIAAGEMAGLQPELSHEPRAALTDEGDGLSAYRIICASLGPHLAPGGRVLVEIGPTQGAAVAALFREAGLTEVAIAPDLDGRDRVVIGTKPR